MSICFVHTWNSEWCDIEIAAWLLVKMVEVVGVRIQVLYTETYATVLVW